MLITKKYKINKLQKTKTTKFEKFFNSCTNSERNEKQIPEHQNYELISITYFIIYLNLIIHPV